VASDLVDFVVLINLTDADLAAKGQVYGDDIVFVDSDGQKLDHEIEYYNGTSGTLVAWVRIPSLSSTVDTTIYMYYGNADAFNQEN
jgi:MSHA biogenesis protein MshQ